MEYLSTLFVSFDKDCCYNKGTIFYGTMMNNNVFCIQDCLLFIGNKPTNFTTTLTNISTFLNKYTNNKPLFNKQIIFSIPFIIDDISKRIDYSVLKYKIKYIQFRCGLYGNNIYYNSHYSHFSENNKIIREIEIKSDDKLPDIYYIADNNEQLLIPDYKTSAKLNTLFNKNKYENNIDLLEESDDDEMDFETPNSITIPCYFNNKFRKWIPNIKIK
jgi:hypothetical protein